MKLVLYSGGATSKNHVIHGSLVDLIGSKRRKSMTYVPFCADGAEPFYRSFQKRYKAFGVTDFTSLKIDQPFTKSQLEDALATDAIYLAGGNTFYFLYHLRKMRLLKPFRKFVEGGGVLAGLSAGAIMMTPHIGLAGYPVHGADPNEVGITDLRALDLVDFEFFPHYRGVTDERTQLSRYAQKSGRPLLACRDGGGIIIDQTTMHFVGKVELFLGPYNGMIHK